ncbi:MAG: GUN4 domain-containing protein [Cyanobacteria bacterium SID2]|nr:GUN4 domain-containing protein [Cyanobacteria bacterium SID2]MBP0002696.1 GUN4 domain-containing protein [Cyanobacteria bacterium SBC]
MDATIELQSERGVDYIRLRNLLAAGRWKEADEETFRVMLQAANRKEEEGLDVEDIDRFPCTDLLTIDRLWVEYSQGKFGFSVQKKIYQSLGGTREYDSQIWKAFGDRVGWRVGMEEWLYYEGITFDLKAKVGHLPVGVWRHLWSLDLENVYLWEVWGWLGNIVVGVSSFASRLVECSLNGRQNF